MIQSIANQPNNQIFYNSTKSIMQKTPPTSTMVSYNPEQFDFFRTIKEQNEKKNKLLLGGILTMIASASLLAFSILSSKTGNGTYGSVRGVWKGLANGFANLKDNKEIPTLDKCKSINKKLRNFLQTQIDYAKVKPEDIKKLGTPEPARKLLLYGPPGTGKSYFAKIYAKSLDAKYTEVKFSDFNSTWSGQHIEQFSSVFEDILANAKAEPTKKFVVVFNEIDSIAMPANALRQAGSSHSMFKLEERSVFLNYIDEIEEKAPNVTIIGTTNIVPRNNNLDGAAMSRFKNIIGIDYPEKECLFEALKASLEKLEGGKNFVEKNEKLLEILAESMSKRKASFRDLNKIVDISKNSYLKDYTKNNGAEFKFKYLEDALKDLDLTDGEISGF